MPLGRVGKAAGRGACSGVFETAALGQPRRPYRSRFYRTASQGPGRLRDEFDTSGFAGSTPRVPLIDALATNTHPTIEQYAGAVAEYVRLAGALTQSQKKIGQIKSSAALCQTVLAALKLEIPYLDHAWAGERPVAGALRTVQADVSEFHPLDGLRLAVEIKPVLLAVGRAVWNRFGDVRTFAVNIHLKFPFSVIGGLMPIPTWEELPGPGSGVRRDTTQLVARLANRFVRAGSRRTEGDAPHLLEGVGVLVFDPDTGAIVPDLPESGQGLRWEEFIGRLAEAYQARFEP